MFDASKTSLYIDYLHDDMGDSSEKLLSNNEAINQYFNDTLKQIDPIVKTYPNYSLL